MKWVAHQESWGRTNSPGGQGGRVSPNLLILCYSFSRNRGLQMLVMEILYLTLACNSHQQRPREQTSPQLLQVFSKWNLEGKHTPLCTERQTMERTEKKKTVRGPIACLLLCSKRYAWFHNLWISHSPLQVAAKIRPRPPWSQTVFLLCWCYIAVFISNTNLHSGCRDLRSEIN